MTAQNATGLKRGLAILLAFEGAREFGLTRAAELVGRETAARAARAGTP